MGWNSNQSQVAHGMRQKKSYAQVCGRTRFNFVKVETHALFKDDYTLRWE